MVDNNPLSKKFQNLVIVLISTVLFCFYVLTEYFYYFNLIDNPKANDTNNLILLIVLIILGVFYFVFYLLNMLRFKKVKLYRIMNIVSLGTGLFFGVAIIINLLAASEEYAFDTSNISLFSTVSLTLLGFGLTVVAILFQNVKKKINNDIKNGKTDDGLFYLLIPYFLLFAMGLIFSIASLLNIQHAGTLFYKVIIFRALLYSSFQIIAILIKIFISFVQMIIEKTK